MSEILQKYLQLLMYQYYQVKVICNPEQQINDLGHHREVQQQTQPREVDQNQHENVHEKNQVRKHNTDFP